MNTNPRDPEILKKLFVEVKPSDAASTGKPRKPSLVSIRSMNPKSRTSLEKRKCIVSKSYEYIFGSYEVKSGKAKESNRKWHFEKYMQKNTMTEEALIVLDSINILNNCMHHNTLLDRNVPQTQTINIKLITNLKVIS